MQLRYEYYKYRINSIVTEKDFWKASLTSNIQNRIKIHFLTKSIKLKQRVFEWVTLLLFR